MITIYLQHYEPCPTRQKYHTEHRIGHTLLSHGLRSLYGIEVPAESMDNFLVQNDYGKPALKKHPDIHFNISHCELLVACGFSDSPIGLDIEKIGPFNDHILRKVLTPEEKAFLEQFRQDHAPVRQGSCSYDELFHRFWTLKESRIKQSGMGLSMPMTDFSFTLDLSCNPVKITCSDAGLHFHQEIFEDQYVISTCSETPQHFSLILL